MCEIPSQVCRTQAYVNSGLYAFVSRVGFWKGSKSQHSLSAIDRILAGLYSALAAPP
jgi:hypothetical protein